MQCAHGYSGCIGVSMNGVHDGSRSVASFPSISPFRIAVTGRQKLYVYLASNTAMTASSVACPTIARSLAFCVTSLFFELATESTMGQYTPVPVVYQKLATAVCSGVRLEPFFTPIDLISL
jgi:hypothetical protein